MTFTTFTTLMLPFYKFYNSFLQNIDNQVSLSEHINVMLTDSQKRTYAKIHPEMFWSHVAIPMLTHATRGVNKNCFIFVGSCCYICDCPCISSASTVS